MCKISLSCALVRLWDKGLSKIVYISIIIMFLGFNIMAEDLYSGIKELTLDNGIDVITYNRTNSKICSVRIAIKLPASAENENTAGIRNLLIDIMVRNTNKMNALELSKAIENIGAIVSPVVSKDYIGISASVLEEYLPQLLGILRDIVFNPSFEGFEEEKNKAIQRAQITKDIWSEVLDLWTYKSLKTAYRFEVVGYPDTLKNIEKKDIIKLYNKYVGGNNIVIVLAGNINNIPDLAGKLSDFNIKTKKKNTLDSPVELPVKYNVYVERRNVDSSAFVMGFDSPTRGSDDYVNWWLFSTYLSNKLDDEIRQKRGWAYSAHSMLLNMLTKSFLIIRSDISNPENIDTAINISKRYLDSESIKSISDSDFSLAKNMVVGSLSRANQTSSEIASDILSNYLYKLPLNYSEVLLEKAKNIKKGDVLDLSSTLPRLTYSLIKIISNNKK